MNLNGIKKVKYKMNIITENDNSTVLGKYIPVEKKDKSYQGEYAYLGSISRLDIRDFTNDDGVVNYYDDWHKRGNKQ